MSEELTLEGKFKSAKDLKLTEKQYCGLIQTLAWLEAGKLDHENEKVGIQRFDMEYWRQGFGCGTVCCIGGTAEVLAGLPMRGMADKSNRELGRLFFPGSIHGWDSDDHDHPGWKASTAQAAVALRGYLETGKADWDAAMKPPKTRRK